MDLTDPQQINGYAYANNNPLTFSDPTGLYCDGCSHGNPDSAWAPGKGNGPGCSTYACRDKSGKVQYLTGGVKKGSKPRAAAPSTTINITQKNKQVVIEGIVIPTARVLEAQYPQYSEENRVEAWAKGKCETQDSSLRAFCGAAEALGIIDYTPNTFDRIVMSLAAPDIDAWKSCLTGQSTKACGTAALDLPWARALKGVKIIKAAKNCNSFVPGTEVLMADGTTKPIEDVRIGDMVLATDPKTGETSVKTVTAEITGTGMKNLVTMTLAVEGEKVSITATEGHPFWVPALNAWIDAGELAEGQDLRTADGKSLRVTGIKHTRQAAEVHNLTVAGLHTYYVLAGATPVLVHNDSGFDWEKELENLKKSWDSGDLDDDGYHAPRGNQAENKEFKDALREIERSLGREITPAERRSLHDRITGQGYGYHRIVEEGKGLFGGC